MRYAGSNGISPITFWNYCIYNLLCIIKTITINGVFLLDYVPQVFIVSRIGTTIMTSNYMCTLPECMALAVV